MAATLGVSTLSYLPFLWFNFLVVIITLIYGFTGKFIWYTKSQSEDGDFENNKKDAPIVDHI